MIGKRLRYFVKPRTGEKISFLTKQIFIYPDGRVFDNTRKRFIKQHENQYGYLLINLTDDNGNRTSFSVHDLVATCFIRLFQKGVNVHHVDKNPKNNRIENLQIIDGGEHSRIHNFEKWKNGTYDGNAEKIRKAWKNSGRLDCEKKKVAQLTIDGRLVRVWPSTAEAGRNGYSHGCVAACCRGEKKYKTHKGYKWMWYLEYLSSQPTPQQQFEARQIYLDI